MHVPGVKKMLPGGKMYRLKRLTSSGKNNYMHKYI